MPKFEIYKARFTPKPADDRGYADLDTTYLFETETGVRLNHLGSELVRIGGEMQISPDKRMLTIKGSAPGRNQKVEFYLAGFKDTDPDQKPGSERYSCEVEITLAANSTKLFNWAKELLESELPPGIAVERGLKYIQVTEKPEGMPDIRFTEYLMIGLSRSEI